MFHGVDAFESGPLRPLERMALQKGRPPGRRQQGLRPAPLLPPRRPGRQRRRGAAGRSSSPRPVVVEAVRRGPSTKKGKEQRFFVFRKGTSPVRRRGEGDEVRDAEGERDVRQGRRRAVEVFIQRGKGHLPRPRPSGPRRPGPPPEGRRPTRGRVPSPEEAREQRLRRRPGRRVGGCHHLHDDAKAPSVRRRRRRRRRGGL
mmetsp:Transcript_3104/g.10234  ORF Transcript_3104/g.10234 Transcript_3104/m.10234 type:complete len:201 (-) Transcript_3104:1823-2425(-)